MNASTPPSPPPPKKKKSKSGGCLTILFFLILIGIVAAVMTRNLWKDSDWSWSKWRQLSIPFVGSETEGTKAPDVAAETKEAKPAEDSVKVDELPADAPSLEPIVIGADKEIVVVESPLEQEDWRTDNRRSSRQPGDGRWALRLIDLGLQLSGDTATAADDLRYLAQSFDDQDRIKQLFAEARRLETQPPRSGLVGILRTLRQQIEGETAKAPPAESVNEADEGKVVGAMKSLFRYKRLDRSSPTVAHLSLTSSDVDELIFLLVTRQERTYWERLQNIAQKSASQEARAHLNTLLGFGRVDYRLSEALTD